jgi:cell pole-organizing protein PopZ
MMGQDPNMQGQDPTMMGAIGMPAQAPTLSPTDLAIAETIQSLQQENQLRMQQIQDQQQQQQAQMQQEAESNEKLISILSRIQERSSAIGSATNGMVPPEAMQSPLAAGQMLAPEPPPQPEPPPMPVMNEETPSSEEMVASQIHPELAEQAADLHDKGMFDTSVLSVMAAAPLMREVVSTYIPNLEKALDNLGRIQLTLWISEPDTKAAIGNDSFVLIENKLRSVFKGLGEVVLQINRNALDKEENVSPSQRTLGDQQ